MAALGLGSDPSLGAWLHAAPGGWALRAGLAMVRESGVGGWAGVAKTWPPGLPTPTAAIFN